MSRCLERLAGRIVTEQGKTEDEKRRWVVHVQDFRYIFTYYSLGEHYSILCKYHRARSALISDRQYLLPLINPIFNISEIILFSILLLFCNLVALSSFWNSRFKGLNTPSQYGFCNILIWHCLEWDPNPPAIMTSTVTDGWKQLQPTAGLAVQTKEDSPHKRMARDASADTNKQFTSPTPTCAGKINDSHSGLFGLNDSLVRNASGGCFSVSDNYFSNSQLVHSKYNGAVSFK